MYYFLTLVLLVFDSVSTNCVRSYSNSAQCNEQLFYDFHSRVDVTLALRDFSPRIIFTYCADRSIQREQMA